MEVKSICVHTHHILYLQFSNIMHLQFWPYVTRYRLQYNERIKTAMGRTEREYTAVNAIGTKLKV